MQYLIDRFEPRYEALQIGAIAKAVLEHPTQLWLQLRVEQERLGLGDGRQRVPVLHLLDQVVQHGELEVLQQVLQHREAIAERFYGENFVQRRLE